VAAMKDLFGWEGRYRCRSVPTPRHGPLRPGVTVLIPTWNAADLLHTCLNLLQQQDLQPSAVLVVDNASADSTAEVVREFPDVQMMRLDTNMGYSGALAHALEWVDTDYAAVLNNDARPESGWLRALARRLDEDPQLGCAFPLSIRTDGFIDTAGDVITSAGFAYKRLFRRPNPEPPASDVFVSPPGVAPVYRTVALLAAGGWDAGLHSQWDDLDLGIRLWRAGWSSILESAVRVVHGQGVSSARRARTREFLAARNETVVLLKTMSAAVLIRMLPRHLLYLTLTLCSHFSRGNVSAFVAGKVAALASLGAVVKARRTVPRKRPHAWPAFDPRWVHAWFGLSRWGGRKAPSS